LVRRTKRPGKYYVNVRLTTKSRQLDYAGAKKLKASIKKRNPKAVVNITKA